MAKQQTDTTNSQFVDIALQLTQAGCSEQTIKEVLHYVSQEKEQEKHKQYFSDLRNLQADLKNLIKNSRGHGGIRYTDLATWTSNVRDHIAQHNFSIICSEQSENSQGSDVTVSIKLCHINGYNTVSSCRFPRDTANRGKSDIQAMGSTLTYARRYLLGMLLNVATTDEDPDQQINDAQLISEVEKQRIKQLCEETQANIPAMLKHIGAESIDTMTRAQAQLALNGLTQKLKKKDI